MTRQELRVWFGKWTCGCGSPEATARFVFDVLNTIQTRWSQSQSLSLTKASNQDAREAIWKSEREALAKLLPSVGIECFVLYIFNDWDLLEHGGSVGGSWLTDTGREVLAALQRETSDDFEALCESACIHGFSDSDGEHDCMAMEDP